MRLFTPSCTVLQTLAIALLAAGQAVAQDGLPLPAAEAEKPAAAPATASESSNAFAYDLYRIVTRDKDNVLFSPYSITTALGMTYAGAKGETRAQMRQVLHFSGDDAAVHTGLGALKDSLQSPAKRCGPPQSASEGIAGELSGGDADAKAAGCADDTPTGATLRIANRLFPLPDLTVKADFEAVIRDTYRAPFTPLDFAADPEGSREAINAWVSEETEDKIPELLKSVHPETKLVLVNAIYFKGAWESEFDKDKTMDWPFTLDDGTEVMTPTMFQEGAKLRMSFDPETFSQVIEIPFKGGKESMVVFMAGFGKSLSDLEAKLSPAWVDGLLANAGETEQDLYFPKFKVESEFQLAKALSELGMVDAFSQADADFSGISDLPGLHVTKVVHKAVAGFDEEGAEAAAATAVVAGIESAMSGVRVNRPFVYMIRSNETGAILFMGRMQDPSK